MSMSEPPLRSASRRPCKFLCVLASASLLGACSLVPTYTRPAAPPAARFDGAAQISLADTTPVRSEWWRAYRDPALDALVDSSLRNNFSLASAVAVVEQARGNAEKIGAPQYPSLSLGASYDRSHQGGNHGAQGSTGKSQSVFAEASYEVDFWGLAAANTNAAELLARASEFDRDTVALTLTASVVNTYFTVQSLRRRVMLAQTISSDASRILQLLLAQQDAGVARPSSSASTMRP
jgi:outer membrane protein TolC